MLRIHFTASDLGRLRLAANADPLWEAMLSQHVLTDGGSHPRFDAWRDTARARLTPQMRALMTLAPPRGYTPDFLTPTHGQAGLEAGLNLVGATPAHLLRADLDLLTGQGTPAAWTRRLADGDGHALRTLTATMRRYFEATLAAFWDLIRSEVAAERALRARIIADRGSEWVLATLHPTMRWQPPVLHIVYPHDRDIHLNGRGLTLLPSFFCRRAPITLRVCEGEPILVYPIEPALRPAVHTGPALRRELVALLGHTRASVLQAVASSPYGRTTGELAGQLRISLSSASGHAATLRKAGLLTSRTSGRQTLHTITALGESLLGGMGTS
ncbi:ArsR/SmtB family transcription factor [Allorhizocola rhizosphaerae]|uniref:ArsR/SmtB family transcription factor n=1 Tax=Allorhizocola rhizosphaerae TaxID=1872709 RepID=UPI000E3C8146|nr:helix-turn-helix domain-containing protein [Allorhizocola rhizosphaerae]